LYRFFAVIYSNHQIWLRGSCINDAVVRLNMEINQFNSCRLALTLICLLLCESIGSFIHKIVTKSSRRCCCCCCCVCFAFLISFLSEQDSVLRFIEFSIQSSITFILTFYKSCALVVVFVVFVVVEVFVCVCVGGWRGRSITNDYETTTATTATINTVNGRDNP